MTGVFINLYIKASERDGQSLEPRVQKSNQILTFQQTRVIDNSSLRDL
jgi:hypothetical protein